MRNPLIKLKSLYARIKKNRSYQFLARWDAACNRLRVRFAKKPIGNEAVAWFDRYQEKLNLIAAQYIREEPINKDYAKPSQNTRHSNNLLPKDIVVEYRNDNLINSINLIRKK